MIFKDYKDLCAGAAREILDFSNQQIASYGRFTMALSGGKTPTGVYQTMASPSFRRKFNWKKIHFFWSDERWVPADNPRSNFRMAYETLLSKVPIPSQNIHAVPTSGDDPAHGAEVYEEHIRRFFKLKKGGIPVFDLMLLGVGLDGHTASLFPGSDGVSVKHRLVIPVLPVLGNVPEDRISLTLSVINHSRMIFFLASGREKAEMVQGVLEHQHKKLLPVDRIKPDKGEVIWFLDQAAAGKLSPKPKRIGIAADHGGYALKKYLTQQLRREGYEVVDFGNRQFDPSDDYPDFVVPLARAVSRNKLDRGVAVCSSGVGACIAANKIAGVRACMIHESFSARQGVEDDDMNVICLGSKVLQPSLAWKLVTLFLAATFSNATRHRRRLHKIALLENRD